LRIIVNALSGNGDALMFSPALRLLREKLPDAEIEMLVMFKSVMEMYANHPALSKIHYIDFLKQPKLRSIMELRKLKTLEYDYSVNVYPSNRLEYNIVNSLLGAKKKIAHHYIHTNPGRAEFVNDILINEVKDRHNVLQNIDLIKPIVNVNDESAGRMEIFISDEDAKNAEEWLAENGLTGKRIAGIHAGSSLLKNHINKRWQKQGYSDLIKYLYDEKGFEVLLFGTEYELNKEVISMSGGNAKIASTPNFMDSIARMRHCSVFISNDTAFMHCAAALQLPTLAIFGYTNSRELYPWQTKNVVVRKEIDCSPCFYNSPKPAECKFTGAEEFKCMKLITTDEVIKAVDLLLD
jgi:heptosyltransferase-2